MGYLFLICTILTESAAVICMKLSNGFQNKMFAAIAILTYAASFVFLTLALRSLHAGIANAVWAGASTLLVAILGVYVLDEKMTVIQVVSLLLVVIGIAGLNINKAV
jgi:multidrug transporter EmrE-like cation transporter